MGPAGRIVASGIAAGALSAVVAAACSRIENRHAARAINAVAHIYDGGAPPRADGPARRNTWIGLGLHTGASVWWAAFFEGIFGRRARSSMAGALAGGATVAAAAYVVDYHVVSKRFQPGFERYLSGPSMFAVYASLALAFALSARSRRLRDHQVEDRHEGEERRDAERDPDRVITPETRRQRLA